MTTIRAIIASERWRALPREERLRRLIEGASEASVERSIAAGFLPEEARAISTSGRAARRLGDARPILGGHQIGERRQQPQIARKK